MDKQKDEQPKTVDTRPRDWYQSPRVPEDMSKAPDRKDWTGSGWSGDWARGNWGGGRER